jgi:hypothetical protein
LQRWSRCNVDPLLALLVALILAAILGIGPADELAAGLGNAAVITVAAIPGEQPQDRHGDRERTDRHVS